MNCIKPACDAQDPTFCKCDGFTSGFHRAMLSLPTSRSAMVAAKHDTPPRRAKGSELIALQRKINRRYGHECY